MAEYTPPTLTGYNTDPPPDDGSETEANRVKWATIKTKLTDPLRTYIDAINSAVDSTFDALNSVWSSSNSTTTNTTVTAAQNGQVFDCDASGGAFTITLPTVASAGDGFRITVLKNDTSANAITIDGNGAETIDGQATVDVIREFGMYTVFTNGTEWFTSAAGSEGWQMVDAQTASNSTTLDFTKFFDVAYQYKFVFEDILPATDGAVPQVQISTDGGSTFKAGASDYAYEHATIVSGSVLAANSTGATSILLTRTGIGNVSTEGFNGEALMEGADGARNTSFRWQFTGKGTAGQLLHEFGSGIYTTAGVTDAAQFSFDSGNISSGTIRLYRLAR